jgi:hypothetical protein
MTNSSSRSKLLGALIVACAVLGIAGVARADRKRVVVLEFEGPRAERFHEDVVKLIKKTHAVVSTEAWNGAAEELGAAGVSERSIAKVAKKLRVDAVVEGRIEKRRDAFLLRLKLHDASGELVGNPVDTRADGPRLDGRAQQDVKDELLGAIARVAGSRASVADDEDEPPVKKPAGKTDKRGKQAKADDEDERPTRKATKEPAKEPKETAKADEDEEEKPARRRFSKSSGDQRGGDRVDRSARDDEDRRPSKKVADDERRPSKADDDDDERKPSKKLASRDEDGEVDAEALDSELALSPGERALDLTAGLSLTMRRMTFDYRADLMAKPSGYKGTPVGGAMVDATFYPAAFGHTSTGPLKHLGFHVMYDRVLKLNSKDAQTGEIHATTESRFSIGAVYRHPFGSSARSPVVAGTLGYSSQAFTISGTIDIPNVKYSILEAGAALRYPVTAKIIAGLDARAMAITSAGAIESQQQYGDSRVLGVEGALAVDYLITRNIFARAALRMEMIKLTFTGNGDLVTMRDGNPETRDVSGAVDSYFGAVLTAGYLY